MKISTVVKVANGYVWIDTCWTIDAGFETMAFPSDEKGRVLDWGEVAVQRYGTWDDAVVGHEAMCKALENVFEIPVDSF